MSTVPDCRAIRRAEGSGMDLRMILLTLAFSPQYSLLRSSTIWSSLVQLTNLKGPVPTGCMPIFSL